MPADNIRSDLYLNVRVINYINAIGKDWRNVKRVKPMQHRQPGHNNRLGPTQRPRRAYHDAACTHQLSFVASLLITRLSLCEVEYDRAAKQALCITLM
jgi:hypothetical protein